MASLKGGGAETTKNFQISINRDSKASEPELRHSFRLMDKSNTKAQREQQRAAKATKK